MEETPERTMTDAQPDMTSSLVPLCNVLALIGKNKDMIGKSFAQVGTETYLLVATCNQGDSSTTIYCINLSIQKIKADISGDVITQSIAEGGAEARLAWATTVMKTFRFVQIQLLPDNEMIVVNRRCGYHPPTTNGGDPYENCDKNACIYDQTTGELKRAFCFGDGIEDVNTSEGGLIWVSYFDEGIFGNWAGPTQVGSCGLICWDSKTGQQLYRYKGPCFIADCYAVNVVSDREAWTYHYYEFPMELIKVTEEPKSEEETKETPRAIKVEHEIWPKCPIQGASAFALAEPRRYLTGGLRQGVLLSGEYKNRNRLCYLSLHHGTHRTDVERFIRFEVPEGPTNNRDWYACRDWVFWYWPETGQLYGISAQEIDVALHPQPSLKTLCAAKLLHTIRATTPTPNGTMETEALQEQLDKLPIPTEIKALLAEVHESMFGTGQKPESKDSGEDNLREDSPKIE